MTFRDFDINDLYEDRPFDAADDVPEREDSERDMWVRDYVSRYKIGVVADADECPF